ncbi:Ethyl tert-butyl ether degradation EthD [Mycolicibacterium rhodesiae JS60]|nr:Ethyl tert-butyl ether degradation EthD [Mycolicibacterium rhodesiae JS60]
MSEFVSETKITVIYDNPTNPEAFEAAYAEEQLEAARCIPGYIRFEASKVWPKEDGSPTPAHRMIDLYYPDYDAASAAVATPEFGAFFEAMGRLSTGGVRILFSDIEIPQQ